MTTAANTTITSSHSSIINTNNSGSCSSTSTSTTATTTTTIVSNIATITTTATTSTILTSSSCSSISSINNGYMASDMWLRTILIVRKETRCRHIGYSYRLTTRVLLYAPSHKQDNTYHGLCYTSREHWLEREIAQWVHPMKNRSDDPSHHERTLYVPLPR